MSIRGAFAQTPLYTRFKPSEIKLTGRSGAELDKYQEKIRLGQDQMELLDRTWVIVGWECSGCAENGSLLYEIILREVVKVSQ